MPQRTTNRRTAGKGRATPSAKSRQVSGRYTQPIPRETRRSPRWYPWMLLALLLGGVIVIILNYTQLLPASPTNWYTVGGLGAILAGALAATRYH